MERKNGSQDVSKQAKRIEVDVAKYQAMLDNSDVAESVKEQFIRDLWSVICGWVELGYQVSPAQDAQRASTGVCDTLDWEEIKEKQNTNKEAADLEPRPGE
ncbi:MAG: hypothetical protein AAFQ13_04320 [Pseudomonadota bacterium]